MPKPKLTNPSTQLIIKNTANDKPDIYAKNKAEQIKSDSWPDLMRMINDEEYRKSINLKKS